MHLETLAVHSGDVPDPTGAVAPPIHLATTFRRGEHSGPVTGDTKEYIYIRYNNPNRDALEQAVAALEGGAAAAAFASGLAAAAAVFQTFQTGDHVLLPADVYHGMRNMARDVFAAWGLQVSYADMTRADAVRGALRPNTRCLWLETPSNPLLQITDLEAVAAVGRAAGALVVCDNTWPTPMLQRPLEHGCDAVVHSSTKYFGGHSDVQGGLVIAKTAGEWFQKLRAIQKFGGATPSPFDCWLIHRGIRTLPCRMRVHGENAQRIAEYLAGHRRIEAVHYPGLPSHPGNAVAKRQMQGFGGMISFQVRGGAAETRAIVSRARLFVRATSLGGVESLIEHRASVEGPATTTPQNLIRLSIGLEHADDLIADLTQALQE